ncbi:MAG TPA: IPTL-CTERM sorting domain-containing protein [Thermoanaerobaculia bacterium]|jgi:uncharacterized repeat protein (TIGR01451 family)
MAKLYRVLAVLCLFVTPALFAQSADQEVVSVVDSPDPVTPGATLSYTVTVRNNGPDAATNGGLNINLSGALTHTTDVVPAGWSCFWSGNNGTCNTPSFAAGATAEIVVNATVGAHLANFPDQDITSNFFPSGTTSDPNNGNNMKTATTTVNSPQVDLSVVASDSPDPVAPDGNVTYEATVTNGGPNSATDVNFNVVPNSSLSFQSATIPSGWSCALPAVGAINATFTCSRATFAPGSAEFVVVFKATDEQFGIRDTTFQTNFTVNGTGDDTNDDNNVAAVQTAYVTPDADITLAVVDSPDPVFPDGNITYTVTVGNTGPNAAPDLTLNSFGGNNLRFVSATVPAGWNCTLPAPGAQTAGWTCTLPSGMAVGDSDVLTFVLQAARDFNGNADGTILFGFVAQSSIFDPDDEDNDETESTQYVTPDADLSVTATDSPDPVGRGDDITYTVTVANAGPDSAEATLTVPMNGTLKFKSMSVPAGFVCTGVPAPGSASTFSCTDTTFASGDSAQFTIVLNVDPESFGLHDGTINQVFSVTGNISDPDGDDNMVQVSTTYDPSTSDIGVTATDAPDPVNAGSNITYSGTVTNGGPDAGTNATLTIPLNSALLFQSLNPPSGFTCTTPAVGANGTITCTIASLPNGSNLPFSVVAQVNPSLASGPDGFIEQTFLAGSSNGDPAAANNELDVVTQYLTPDADLAVTNSDTPDPVAPGGVITYTQSITNNGPDPAVNATFTQTLPASVGFVSLGQVGAAFTCATPAIGASGTITCSTASLASGASTTFTLVVDVEASSGTVGNTVTADSDTFDPDNSDNVAGVTTTIVAPASADLSITKTTGTTSASPGDTIQYTIAITNAGPDDATAVVMTDTLPAQLLFQSITEPAGFDCVTPAAGTSGTITCTAATLADGATATFQLAVTVAGGATSGSVTNSASVASATGDPDGGDTSGNAPAIGLAPVSADLSISKDTDTNAASPGDTIEYEITVTNDGPDDADDVVVTDVLPPQLRFQSIVEPAGFDCTTPAVGANGTVTCSADTMAADTTAVFRLFVTVGPGQDSGTVTNQATVTSPTADPDSGDRSDAAPPVALGPSQSDLSVTKTTTTTTVAPGSTFSYTISITNAGPDADTDVGFSDVLPASLLFVSLAEPDDFDCTTPAAGANGTVTCTNGTLLDDETATFTLTVRVAENASPGPVTNNVTVTGASDDPDATDNADAAPPVTVGPASADLSIVKSTTTTDAKTGDTVFFNITVSNAGPSTASNVVVTDTIPAGLELVLASPSQGTCSGTTVVTCNLGDILSGANATITLQTTVTGNSGTVSNTATVTSADADPDGGDNASTTPPFPIGSPGGGVAQVPTVSEWALIALAMMLGMAALAKMRI